MTPTEFNATEPLLDEMAELVESRLLSAELRRVLSELSTIMGNGRGVSLNISVDVFDDERECSLPLLTMGMSSSNGKEPYPTWGDSTPHRYVVDAGIQVVPHDRCPGCWQEWDFKLKNPSCSHCGMTLGKNCTLLLDSDQCPWCEAGQFTMANPRCSNCGHEVYRKRVTWG